MMWVAIPEDLSLSHSGFTTGLVAIACQSRSFLPETTSAARRTTYAPGLIKPVAHRSRPATTSSSARRTYKNPQRHPFTTHFDGDFASKCRLHYDLSHPGNKLFLPGFSFADALQRRNDKWREFEGVICEAQRLVKKTPAGESFFAARRAVNRRLATAVVSLLLLHLL